jgi:uncharacterized protein YndB with AHSA1/START domain
MMHDDDTTVAVVIERTFDAPVHLVWQMWTDPAHVRAWYGPAGASLPVLEMDVRVGGARRVCMEVQSPDGPRRMWFVGEYVEVVDRERLVYTESMAGPDGVVPPDGPGGAAAHPAVTEVRVELRPVGEHTAVVLTHVGIPSDSPGAAGWRMALDKLAVELRARHDVA